LDEVSARQKQKQEECKALKWCGGNLQQGRCVWRSMRGVANAPEVVSCECNAHFMGEQCQEAIPNKRCKAIAFNKCTAHPDNWFQDDCTVHGSEYKYKDWKYCWGIFGVKHKCIRKWECSPYVEGEDCCVRTGGAAARPA